jgi:hypothetical protein
MNRKAAITFGILAACALGYWFLFVELPFDSCLDKGGGRASENDEGCKYEWFPERFKKWISSDSKGR